MKKLLTALLIVIAAPLVQAQWAVKTSPNLPNSFFYQVEAINSSTAWAASPNMEVVKTTDGGNNWSTYPIVDPVFTSGSVTSLAALDANNAWIIVGEMGQTYFSRIYRTTDGGTTWQYQPTAYPNPGSYGFHIHFFDANNGVALGFKFISGQPYQAEIITTNNAGVTWTPVSAANMPSNANDFMYNTLTTVGNTIWIMDVNLNILKSVDKGLTWVSKNPGFSQALGGMETSLAFTDANNGLAGVNGQLKRTTDGGATWTTITPTGAFFPFNIIPVPGTSVYLSSSRDAGNRGSSISYDHGSSWIQLENTFRHFDMEFVDANTGYSGGFNQMQVFRGALLGLGKEPLTLNNSFTISPNPSTGIFTVAGNQLQPFTIEVYNLIGSKVFQKQSTPLTPTKLDLSNQPKGIYVVKITCKGQVQTKKILIQ